jgi:glutamine---fructose-6-phosphate transaminase (isomerizing)
MCGIVGSVGNQDVRQFLLQGLKALEYRGYDSAGVAFITEDKPIIYRLPGRVHELEKIVPEDIKAKVGIGHTRWATHGAPTVGNAHPHESQSDLFTLVHNGVIHNFRYLKKKLENEGYQFHTETDTEVIVNLLERYYHRHNDVLLAIEATMRKLEGSYALVILFSKDKEKIYFAKNHSPLVIGHSDKANYLASDYIPMLKFASEFVTLGDRQYGFVSDDKIKLFELDNNQPIDVKYHKTDLKSEDMNLMGYPNYMLKEIEEGPEVIHHLIDNYFDGQNFTFDKELLKIIKDADQLILLACGTSYNACLIGRRYFESLGKQTSVYIASEWAYYPEIKGHNPLFIMVSQSGETADLINCMAIVNNRGNNLLTITNTKGSSLDRNADFTLLLYAGIEIAVASTKAYLAQIALFALLKGAISDDLSVITDLGKVIEAQKEVIKGQHMIIPLADHVATQKDVFFLGRGYDYDLALEASLKLKEVSYIHSEALPGGELKHGPIALIEKDMPVVFFISDPITSSPIRSNIQEVIARGARAIVISNRAIAREEDDFVVGDVPLYLSPLVKIVIGQYLTYYTALKLGLNIDKPRNLAKAVTVE